MYCLMRKSWVIFISLVTVLFLTACLVVSSLPETQEINFSDNEYYKDLQISQLGYGIISVFANDFPEPMEKVPTSVVSFVACGDNLVHSTVYSDAKTLAQGTTKEYNFLPMYENVLDIIEGADIAFINQETPFGGPSRPISGYPLFNTPDQVGYDIAELGFDVVGLANNHMLDSTSAGYERTIEFWDNIDDVLGVGGYKNKEDYENIRILEKNGIKIAFLAYTYGTNGLSLPASSELVIPMYNDEDIDRQTKKAREIADCVIVSIHWGNEDAFSPNAEQKRKAQIMIDNGVSIENAYFIPTMCHYNYSVREFKIYRFSEYSEELEKVHGAHKFDSAMSMRYMRNIIDDAIPQEFLTEEFYKE